MKSSNVLKCVLLLISAWALSAGRSEAQIQPSFFAAGRYHQESATVPDLPYAEGDWSTMVGLELHEGIGYWQLAVDFSDGVGGTNEIGNIITPQLNLMFAENGVAAGFGVLSSYIEDEVNGDDWTDIYFQFNLGFNIPLGDSLGIYAMTHFIFENWDGISDFDFDELEYSAGLSLRF